MTDDHGQSLAAQTIRIDTRRPDVAISSPLNGAVLPQGSATTAGLHVRRSHPGLGVAGACTSVLDASTPIANGANVTGTIGATR